MTLIAHSLSFKVPFVVGDILLSHGIKTRFIPPTISVDISEHLGEYRSMYPAELAQKVYIIRPNLVVAFAGNEHEIKELLKELRIKCRYNPEIKEAHIRKILDEYDLVGEFGNSAFFMMLIEQRLNEDILDVKQFSFGAWDSVETELYNEIQVIGSGSRSFINIAGEKVVFTSSHEQGDIHYAIQSNACLIARLLAIERAYLSTINKNYGAGYEFVFYDGNSFVKFRDVSYVIFDSRVNQVGQMNIPAPSKIIYYKYYRDILVITSIEAKNTAYTEIESDYVFHLENIKVDVFPVPAIDFMEPLDKDEFLKDISFSTTRVALSFIIMEGNEIKLIPSWFSEGQGLRVDFIQYQYAELSIRKEILQRINDEYLKVYPVF